MNRELLEQEIEYDMNSGIFTWKKSGKGRSGVGCIAGSDSHGYVSIRVAKHRYLAHRLAWMFVYGDFPKHQIDHINGIRSDNRICNLREATNAENLQNKAPNATNTSGVLGVSFNSEKRKWVAQIGINGEHKYIGRFNTIGEAKIAYENAKAKYHTFSPIARSQSTERAQ